MNILHTYSETIVDGDGIRYSIYFAGTLLTDDKLDKIIDEINNNPLLDGITLSGGDPFFNPIEMLPIVKKLKDKTQLSIWCYTGFLYEELLKDKHSQAILEYIDVLVDGPFIQEKYSPTLPFRGSTNQRLIKLRN